MIKRAIVSVAGLTLTDQEKYLLSKHNPLGITLFARNIKTPDQLKNLIKEIKETIAREDVLICIDQEGGRVARLKDPFFRTYLSQRALGLLSDELAERAAYLQALLISQELKQMGINLNYAPCLDLLHEETGSVLKSRCFSDNEKKVSLLGKQMIQTYQGNGIIACPKHAPGHGFACVDPHLSLPIIHKSLQELQKDFYSFKTLSKEAVSMMTAHILLPEIDSKPVTQSRKAIHTLIRKEIGFDGFLISDAIDMKALKGSLAEKTSSSLEAGCDAICYCMGDKEGLEEVLKASSYLDDNSLERFKKMKDVLKEFNSVLCVKDDLVQEYQSILKSAPVISDDYDAVEVLNQLKS